MRRRDKENLTNREHIHLCTDLDGACLEAARHIVEEKRLFRSYSELVRVAIVEYYRRLCKEELQMQALSPEREQ